MNVNIILKYIISAMAGAVLAVLKPNWPFILIALVFILVDCWTSYRLARRVKKQTGKSSAKFRSKKGWKVVVTSLVAMSAIVLAWVIQTYILVMYENLYLPNWTAIIICFMQGWSILENESSCNGSRWAQLAQKIVIDKTERHFDIDLHDLFNDKEDMK